MFREIFVAAVALYAMAGSVMAADLPSRKKAPAIAYVPPPAPAGWSGAYAGLQIGHAWQKADLRHVGGLLPVGQSVSPSGVVGGGFAGYQRQIDKVVVGVEGDIEGSGVSGRGPLGAHVGQDVRGSARGRIGLAVDKAHVYATGGLAVADVSYSNGPATLTPGQGRASTAKAGWTVGGGAEMAITGNWFGRAEYRYSDFGTASLRPAGAIGGSDARVTDHSVRAGVGYKIDLAAPVFARY